MRALSYGQVRLRLGILGVGLWVCLCLLALVSGLAWKLSLVEWLLLYLLVSLPLDLLGGQLLPRMWKQAVLPPGLWLKAYLRTSILQVSLMALGCLVLSLVGERDPQSASLLFPVLALLLLEFQVSLSRAAGIPVQAEGGVFWLEARDPRCSGGISGIPGRERLLLPAHWKQRFSSEWIAEHLERRKFLVESGARNSGLLLALLFQALCLSLLLPYSQGNPVVLSASFTLTSFLGLLLLPSLSRRGVLAADAFQARRRGPVATSEWLTRLEALQEEDLARHPGVDLIFHPIPSLQTRLRQLSSPCSPAPWNTARYALLTSWLAGGLLSRAVHCNCGRAELWLWPPCD